MTGKVVSLASQRQKQQAQQQVQQEAGERERMAQQIHWLMGSLESYLGETLTATFHPTHGGWTDRPPLTLEQLRELEARLRGIETELTALREEE